MILSEEQYLTTFEYTKQGTGLIVSVGYLLMPFFASFFTRYVFNHRYVR